MTKPYMILHGAAEFYDSAPPEVLAALLRDEMPRHLGESWQATLDFFLKEYAGKEHEFRGYESYYGTIWVWLVNDPWSPPRPSVYIPSELCRPIPGSPGMSELLQPCIGRWYAGESSDFHESTIAELAYNGLME